MSLAVVPSPEPDGSRPRRPRYAACAATRRARLQEALAAARTPSQRVSAAADHLRAVLADGHRTRPIEAEAAANDVVRLLIEHADQLVPAEVRSVQ